MTRPVRLGVDLDNTIVCYDRLFHRLASERGLLPDSVAATKLAVRTHLRATGQEDVWTELQGAAYGARMGDADEFPGCIEVLRRALAAGIAVRIVSHRTRVPHSGAPHDLHHAAMQWLEGRGLVADRGIALRRGHVHLELTRTAKCARIAALDCTHFIDDLPEVFDEETFPAATERVLFDPDGAHSDATAVRRIVGWEEIGAWISGETARP
jgi:hypothetical protein